MSPAPTGRRPVAPLSPLGFVLVCTSHAPENVVVCDVALPDVKELVGSLPGVTLTHLPYEGTRVESDGSVPVQVFRAAVSEAIALHGGSLPD